MIKKITLLLAFLTVSFGFSQATYTIDFEPAGAGSGWSWTASDNAPSFAEITNPVSGGMNSSSTVIEFIAYTTDQNWALCWTDDNGEFTFDATNSTVKIMVYKPTISNVAIKFEGSSSPIEINVPNTVINQWEELTFDFSGQIGNTYNRLVVIPDFVTPYVNGQDRTTNNTLYFDNLQVPEGVSPAESCSDGIMNQDETGIDCGGTSCAPCASPGTPPTVAAPTPPARDAADVISIYSDAYAPIPFDNFSAGWCGNPAVVEETIAGNLTQHYLGLPCQGIDMQSNRLDLSEFTNIHFDFYTDDANILGKVFNLKLIDFAGGSAEVSSLEINTTDGTFPGVITGEWVSIDIDLTSANPVLIGSLTRSDIAQIGITSNLSNVWYDNMYFYKQEISPGTCSDGIMNQDETGIDCGGTICAPCSGPPTIAAPTPPARNAADVISIYSDAYAPIPFDNFSAGWCGNPAVVEETIAGNLTQHYLGLPCQGIDMQSNRLDLSEFTNIHFDFYTDDANILGKVFNLKLIDFAGGSAEVSSLEINTTDGTFPGVITGEWVSIDIDLTSANPVLIGSLTRSDIAQIGITSNLSNVWYYNMYFYKEETLPGTCSDGIQNGDETGIDCGGSCPNVCPPTPTPTVSAPTPTEPVEDVLYLYSDAYNNATYQIALTNPNSFALAPPSSYSFPSIDVAIPGTNPTDNVRQFDNLENAFIQFSNTDATGMKYFYIDVWSANATFFRVNLQDTSPAVEGSELYPIVQNQWNRIEIDLDTFGGGGLAVDRDDLFQLILFGEPVGVADFYIDNLYFSKEQAVLSTNDIEFTELKVYPNPSSDNWNFVSAQETISDISIYNVLGKQVKSIQPKSLQATIDISNLSSGIYFARLALSTDNAISTIKLIKL